MSQLNRIFSALADPTRRDILARMTKTDLTVQEIAARYPISLPAISKHLNVLEHAGLVIREKDGRLRHCRLIAGPLKEASDWLSTYRVFWNQQLDSLEKYLKEAKDNEKENDDD